MKYKAVKYLSLGFIFPLWIISAQAIPIFDITTSDTPISIAPNGQTTITYNVHNNSGIDMPIMRYFPPPLTTITTGGTCNSFLAKNASCTVALLFTAPSIIGQLELGPLGVCGRQGRACSVPNSRNRVNVIITPILPISMAISGGAYDDGSGIFFPLIAQSINAGSTWGYGLNKTTLPSAFTDSAEFDGAFCDTTICLATGGYTGGAIFYPMIAQTTDNGTTWSYSIDASTPMPTGFTNNGFLLGVICSGNLCVTAGSYNVGATVFPLVAQSINNGASWTYPVDSAGPVPPAGFTAGSLEGVGCTGNLCIAVGGYNIGATGFPLLAQTNNGGATWAYTIDTTTPVKPADYTGNGFFFAASCSSSICIASGVYSAGLGIQFPWVVQSTNSGASWSYVVDTGVTPGTPAFPADGGNGAFFFSASCSGSLCIAAGQYFTPTMGFPLLVQTTNNGASWAYALDSGATVPVTPPPPADYADSGRFDGASCSGSLCIAVGSYLSTDGKNYPLIAQTSNGGTTWAYSVHSNLIPGGPTLPTDFDNNGGFTRGSCNGNFCIAAGQYSDISGNFFPLLAQTTNGGATWSYKIDSSLLPTGGYLTGGLFSAGVSVGLAKPHKVENLFMLKRGKAKQIIPLKPTQ